MSTRRARVRKTKEQKRAAEHLELYGIVHFLLTEQRCPVIFEGRLGYVSCPGVSKDAFKKAIENRVIKNLCHWLDKCGSGPCPDGSGICSNPHTR